MSCELSSVRELPITIKIPHETFFGKVENEFRGDENKLMSPPKKII